MPESLRYWCGLYQRLKYESFCVDIETDRFNGSISVIGLYMPKEGPIEFHSFVRGHNLLADELKTILQDCRLLITYNGLRFDVPKIRKDFPGVLPEKVPVIDLYLFARRLALNTNLKVLENTFCIERMDERTKRRGIAVKLWRKYERYGDKTALQTLVEYNRQDTINLYPLAEELVALVYKRLNE